MCLMLCLALVSCLLFTALVVVELATYDFSQFQPAHRTRTGQGNGNGGGGSGGSAKAPRAGAAAQEKWKGTTAITFDVFDTERVITPLQLQLTVSAALGFDERDVIIEDQDEADIFYRVVVQRADASLSICQWTRRHTTPKLSRRQV